MHMFTIWITGEVKSDTYCTGSIIHPFKNLSPSLEVKFLNKVFTHVHVQAYALAPTNADRS